LTPCIPACSNVAQDQRYFGKSGRKSRRPFSEIIYERCSSLGSGVAAWRAEWIAELLRHGLLRASFIPSRQQRDLRELTRHRSSLAAKRGQAANELQKALESANIKLQSVVTDITGVSATEMLQEMVWETLTPKS
jgi:hypothetical protein